MSETIENADAPDQKPDQIPSKRGALAGIRVLDLTSVVLGPFATQTLGDMGADVIKVESPDGDIMRYAEPMRSAGMGAVFLNINRNKRSVCLNLKKPQARAALDKLIATADVFIHSMRPQAIERLGLGYDAVRAITPSIIYCATVGFSARGPYATRPAYDDIIQGMSGLADLSAQRSGGEPEFAPSIICDKICGLTAYGAVTTALFHRERTGDGQAIEVPMFETMTAFTLAEHLTGHAFVPPKANLGYPRCLATERRPYQTADGYMAVLPYSDRHWQAFFKTAGRPEMAHDPRMSNATERSRHISELYGLVAEIMREKTTAEWADLLSAADIPSVPIKALADLETDPHLTALNFFVDYMHPSEGQLRTTAVPVSYTESPGSPVRRPPPRLGEHTHEILDEVLANTGLHAADIDALFQSGAAIAATARDGQ